MKESSKTACTIQQLTPEILEAVVVLDPAPAIARMLGDQELYWQVYPLFREQTLGKIGRLKAALAAGDADQCRLLTHSIKSSAASVGANQLKMLAGAMEDAAASGDLESVRLNVAQVESCYQSVIEHVRRTYDR